jgi:hypothetical protein
MSSSRPVENVNAFLFAVDVNRDSGRVGMVGGLTGSVRQQL